jgi:hypothetical protein
LVVIEPLLISGAKALSIAALAPAVPGEILISGPRRAEVVHASFWIVT